MSRMAQITITVTEYDSSKNEDIIDAVLDLGYEADPNIFLAGKPDQSMCFDSEVITIRGGQLDDDVASELHEAIWKANGAFCSVNVGILDLDAQYPSFEGDEVAYELWKECNSADGP